jgi:protein associated with RNAse G/E
MWKPGETVVWRGIFRNRVWHAVPSLIVQDTSQELVLSVIPGTNCMVEENYAKSHKDGKRRWDFKEKAWELENFRWHTNRLLFLLEPGKYYSTIYFWNEQSSEFLCYYINFQLPFQRSHCGIDTLDLDLDLIVHPDFTYEWKDIDDYQKGIEHEIIFPEWVQEIDAAKQEIFDKLEKRRYPFDSSWLVWVPDPCWSAPKLPEIWDKL